MGRRARFAGDHLLGALQLLEALGEAQGGGQTSTIEALARSTGLGLARTAQLLEDLLQAGWVVSTDTGRWLLTTRCEDIRLGQLLQALCLSPEGLRNSGHRIGTALAQRVAAIHGPLDESVANLLADSRKPQMG